METNVTPEPAAAPDITEELCPIPVSKSNATYSPETGLYYAHHSWAMGVVGMTESSVLGGDARQTMFFFCVRCLAVTARTFS